MSEGVASSSPVFVPYLPPQSASVKVHDTTLLGEAVLWFGHTLFILGAIIALAFIFYARGPRRKDANFLISGQES